MALVFAILPVAVQAQSVSADVRAGMYTSLGGIGTVGVTRGALRTVPSAAFGVDIRSPGARLGVRLSGALGVSSGARFSPTPQCVTACSSISIVSGKFAGIAADLTAERRAGDWILRLGAGPGILRYDYGVQGFTGPCQAGTMCDDPFREGDNRLAFHVGAIVARPLAGLTLVGTIEDYVSKRIGGGASHDLNVALGVGVGSLWRKRRG